MHLVAHQVTKLKVFGLLNPRGLKLSVVVLVFQNFEELVRGAVLLVRQALKVRVDVREARGRVRRLLEE